METIVKPVDVALEAQLLKTFSIRDNYESYYHLIDTKRLLNNTNLLLKDYKKYYALYPEHPNVDFGLFYTQFSQNWHLTDLNTTEIEYYKDYVFPAINSSKAEDTESCIIGLLKKNTQEELVGVINKDVSPDKLRSILDSFELKMSNILKTVDDEVEKIDTVNFEELDKTKGIPLFLPALQNGLGSLVKGQFVIVSADYGAGKSAFVISQTVHTLRHLKENGDERPILYFNSEGTSADIFGRVCSNLYKDQIKGGFEEVVSKAEEVKRHFIKTFSAEKLLVIQMTSATVEWLEGKIKKYNPALVIIDITDTLAPEEDVQSLKKVYDRLRLLSGKFCPIIGTSQSGDTSYKDGETGEIKNRKWLGDKALYGSKTGKGGAADTIITIGKDDVNPTVRYIATPKKKRGVPVNVTCQLTDKYSLYSEMAW